MILTVCCVWVHANVPYSVEYVVRLKSMVDRYLLVPHDFICLTDRPRELPSGINFIGIPRPQHFGWWSKIGLFNSRHGLSGTVLYFDLDTLIVDRLEPLLIPGDLVLIPHAGTFQGRYGKRIVKRYNSSVMCFDAQAHPELYDECTPEIIDRYWGDQDWIGKKLPLQPTYPLEWFPRLSEIQNGNIPERAKVILCKRPKNHVAAQNWAWFRERWK